MSAGRRFSAGTLKRLILGLLMKSGISDNGGIVQWRAAYEAMLSAASPPGRHGALRPSMLPTAASCIGGLNR